MDTMGTTGGQTENARRATSGPAAAFVLCFVALSLLMFNYWSLNSHLFPLFDTQLSLLREVCTLVVGIALVATAFVSSRRPRLLGARLFVGVAAVGTVCGAAPTTGRPGCITRVRPARHRSSRPG